MSRASDLFQKKYNQYEWYKIGPHDFIENEFENEIDRNSDAEFVKFNLKCSAHIFNSNALTTTQT